MNVINRWEPVFVETNKQTNKKGYSFVVIFAFVLRFCFFLFFCIFFSGGGGGGGRHFQQTGHQPGMVANHAYRGQLKKENRIFPVPVHA